MQPGRLAIVDISNSKHETHSQESASPFEFSNQRKKRHGLTQECKHLRLQLGRLSIIDISISN